MAFSSGVLLYYCTVGTDNGHNRQKGKRFLLFRKKFVRMYSTVQVYVPLEWYLVSI